MQIQLQIPNRRRAAYVRSLLRTGFLAALCGAVIYGSAATAQEANATSDPAKPKNVVHHVKKAAKPNKVVSKGPVYKDAPVVAAAGPACNELTAYAINQKLGLKGWAIPATNMGDSITLDYGCWRSKLAEYGFGFLYSGAGVFNDNLLNHYTPASNNQIYAGQKPLSSVSTSAYLTYDLSRWGLTDGQLEIEGAQQNTTDAPNYGSNLLQLGELKVYGTALDKKIEYEAGYIVNFLRFQGTFIGGNVNNPLGPQSGSAAEVGESFPPQPAPSVNIKYHITDSWYDRFAIQRSMPGSVYPQGVPNMPPPFGVNNGVLTNPYAIEHYSNPAGIKFTNSSPCFATVCYHSPRELFIDEIGYQTTPGPNNLGTWVRLTGYYNNTSFYNQQLNWQTGSTTGTTDNYAVSLYADQQIWQLDPSSVFTAYKGLYVGGTVAYDDPKADALVWDFEARIYTFGMFNRPKDQIALSYQHQTLSDYIANPNPATPTGTAAIAACNASVLCTRHAVNTYALTYTANINHGVYFTIGTEYVDHPSSAWSPTASTYGSAAAPAYLGFIPIAPLNINHAVNLVSSLYFIF
jgi:porin